MPKSKLQKPTSSWPMPVTLLGYETGGKANFLAVHKISMVNPEPTMLAIALEGREFGNSIDGITENGAFSVNLPGIDLMERVDYCALNPSADKSPLFEVFRGDLPGAPMIRECPLCMECRLVQTLLLFSGTLYIGEIVCLHAEEDIFSRGTVEPSLWRPFFVTTPDNRYWELGGLAGAAWHVGEQCMNKRPQTPDGLSDRKPAGSWLEHIGEPLASTREEAAAFLRNELVKAAPDGWHVKPMDGDPQAWSLVLKTPPGESGIMVEYGVRLTSGLDLVVFTCENNDIGALSLHHFLLNGMTIDAAALRHYGVAACLEYFMSQHKPNRWGFT